ncbi:hypothetical protein LguiB_014135 [Lonicera macranthoides]
MDHIVASTYNNIFVGLHPRQCLTYLSSRIPPYPNKLVKIISVALLGNHFVKLMLHYLRLQVGGIKTSTLGLNRVLIKSMTSELNGSSCAACTYNRKRCQPWCEYAPIFRDVISRQDYRTIFTVFGVKNVADILQNIPQYQHLETLYSFLFEAKARIENPIKGCTALLASLEQKVGELQERVTALEARLEGGPSCVNPLCSFAPPRGSSRFLSSVENNAADVIPSAVNPPEPVPGDFLRFLMSAEEIAPEIPPPTVNLMENEAFLTEVESTSPDWTALGDIRHDSSSDLSTILNFDADADNLRILQPFF